MTVLDRVSFLLTGTRDRDLGQLCLSIGADIIGYSLDMDQPLPTWRDFLDVRFEHHLCLDERSSAHNIHQYPAITPPSVNQIQIPSSFRAFSILS